MRGTCAVIGMVLLVVLAAHVQREDARRDEELATSAAAYQGAGGCGGSAGDVEYELAAAESSDAGDAPAIDR